MAIDPADFTPEALSKIAPACVECPPGSRVDLVRGREVYPGRYDLAEKLIWRCACGAYCGCHEQTLKALGRPGGKATRDARQEAHALFDPMWQKRMRIAEAAGKPLSKTQARGRGYKWLAAQMGMAAKECRIAMLSAADARRVAEICRRAKS